MYGVKVECTCANCNKAFLVMPSSLKKYKNFCSPECKDAMTFVSCDYCGKKIKRSPSERYLKNYCSKECKEKAGYNCKCDYCGKEYKARWINPTKNYCSKECRIEDEKNCICSYCGRPFHRAQNKVKKALNFCGVECYLAYVKENKRDYGIGVCLLCGKEFPRNDKRPDQKFCSIRCGSIYSSNEQYRELRERKQKLAEEKVEQKRMIAELKAGLKEVKKRYKDLSKYRECICCGRVFKARSHESTCSTGCSKRYQNRKKDRRIYRNGKPDFSINLARLYRRDRGICQLCGMPAYFVDDIQSDEYPSIDHIVPLSKGGTHEWNNIQLAHRGCNTNKSDKIV